MRIEKQIYAPDRKWKWYVNKKQRRKRRTARKLLTAKFTGSIALAALGACASALAASRSRYLAKRCSTRVSKASKGDQSYHARYQVRQRHRFEMNAFLRLIYRVSAKAVSHYVGFACWAMCRTLRMWCRIVARLRPLKLDGVC